MQALSASEVEAMLNISNSGTRTGMLSISPTRGGHEWAGTYDDD